MSHFLLCDCCESANVEVSGYPTADSFYMCTMCREYCAHLDVDVKPNNFNQKEAIDYSN